MTYIEGMAGLQLVAEQEVGVPMREQTRQENAREDRSMAALRRAQQEMV
jgi:hypothetical protein